MWSSDGAEFLHSQEIAISEIVISVKDIEMHILYIILMIKHFIYSIASWNTSRLFYGKVDEQNIITDLIVIILNMTSSNFRSFLIAILFEARDVSICHIFR